MTMPHLSTASELPLPRSYSFAEQTFSRFFYRACLEYACRAIDHVDSRPDIIRKVFTHSLKYTSLPAIAQRLRKRLEMSAHDDLDSTFVYPPGHVEDGSEVRVYVHADGTTTRHNDGPWFGPEDLDRYLSAKGVRINPASRIVECDTESIDDVEISNPPAYGGPQPGDSVPQSFATEAYGNHVYGKGGQTSSSCWNPSYHVMSQDGMSVLNRPHAYDMGMALTSNIRQGHSSPRKRVKIDVQKLINSLAEASECRGPTPAVLRKDVHRAFESSVISIEAC